jgi:hypothetical protein
MSGNRDHQKEHGMKKVTVEYVAVEDEKSDFTDAVILSKQEYDSLLSALASATDLQAYWYRQNKTTNALLKLAKEQLEKSRANQQYLLDKIAKADENEVMDTALQRIDAWCKAYPLDVFPEPDFKQVRVLLEAGGITLDSVSASNMRHVLKGMDAILVKWRELRKEQT